MNHDTHPCISLRQYSSDLPAHLRILVEKHVIDNGRFYYAPGGKTRHHGYEGGLAQHTLEVVRYCHRMTGGSQATGPMLEIQRPLMVAAMFHDFAKIHSYQLWEEDTGTVIHKTEYESKIGHLVGSVLYFTEACRQEGISHHAFIENVQHMMLAHHGRHEWRSPVEPQTLGAHILHAADMQSMQDAGREGDKK